ncbi:hypothetical protein BJ508DRAFT_312044 [Ascobolus immersus RN42]|uniref:Uncharacterized protein n=1 Tax=Ascobolus immersus RN42 TaxID=1160509 RepID=A0A3N4I0G0_ASCIM|nr:hypothetical protein BJ508DRAFT_312044 [Ascobolus immersus RN42]
MDDFANHVSFDYTTGPRVAPVARMWAEGAPLMGSQGNPETSAGEGAAQPVDLTGFFGINAQEDAESHPYNPVTGSLLPLVGFPAANNEDNNLVETDLPPLAHGPESQGGLDGATTHVAANSNPEVPYGPLPHAVMPITTAMGNPASSTSTTTVVNTTLSSSFVPAAILTDITNLPTTPATAPAPHMVVAAAITAGVSATPAAPIIDEPMPAAPEVQRRLTLRQRRFLERQMLVVVSAATAANPISAQEIAASIANSHPHIHAHYVNANGLHRHVEDMDYLAFRLQGGRNVMWLNNAGRARLAGMAVVQNVAWPGSGEQNQTGNMYRTIDGYLQQMTVPPRVSKAQPREAFTFTASLGVSGRSWSSDTFNCKDFPNVFISFTSFVSSTSREYTPLPESPAFLPTADVNSDYFVVFNRHHSPLQPAPKDLKPSIHLPKLALHPDHSADPSSGPFCASWTESGLDIRELCVVLVEQLEDVDLLLGELLWNGASGWLGAAAAVVGIVDGWWGGAGRHCNFD